MRVGLRVLAVDVKDLKKRIPEAHVRAVTSTTEAARMDTLPYVPWLEGNLARTADTESKPSEGLLVYGNNGVPYARAQYYGLPHKSTDRHPLATMQWFEHSAAANKEKWKRVMAKEYGRKFGRR